MKGKHKGDEGMTTLTLQEIEKRALQNHKKYEHVVNKVISQIENQNLNRGRVRPKDPTEANILARFNRQ